MGTIISLWDIARPKGQGGGYGGVPPPGKVCMAANEDAVDAGAASLTGVPETQAEVVGLLADPASYGEPVARVERHDTHAAMVFLAGARAFKVKRAVSYPYLDFGTLARRIAVCRAEIARNRRTAPALYLGLCPVRRRSGGALYLGELIADPEAEDALSGDDLVEVAVVMRRFDQEALLANVHARDELTPALLDALADHVAAFHDSAGSAARDPVAGHRTEIADNTADLRQRPDIFDADAVADLDARANAELDRLAPLLNDRAAAGCVRRCHGDLHLANIVLWDGQPTLFDAIEFNDALAEIDVLYDLAFLLMDLDRRGARAAANRVLNRYMGARDDLDGLAALPFHLSLRAAIRAKVGATALATLTDPAAQARQLAATRGYFEAARAYLRPAAPVLVAIGGVSGTGKTTVARALAPDLGAPPGALVIRSDVERKRLFGVAETERLPESAYQGSANARVYDRIMDQARRGLAAGRSVVLEATFLRREDRARARKLAQSAGVAFAPVWLTAPAETLKQRVDARTADASDATSAVVAAQLERAPGGQIPWPGVDASGAVAAVVARVRDVLRTAGVAVDDEGEAACDGSG